MSGHITVGLGTTYCPDTPENWLHFHRLKRAILSRKAKPPKPTDGAYLNEALQQQISKENKDLRSLRRYLPGHEPDRFFD